MCIEFLYNYLSNSIKFYCFTKLVKAIDRFVGKKIRDVWCIRYNNFLIVLLLIIKDNCSLVNNLVDKHNLWKLLVIN